MPHLQTGRRRPLPSHPIAHDPCQLVHCLPLLVPRPFATSRHGSCELAAQLNFLRITAARLLESSHAVARHLLHENPTVPLSKLAALQKIHLLEPRITHKRVASNFLLQLEAHVNSSFYPFDFSNCNGLHQLNGWDCGTLQALAKFQLQGLQKTHDIRQPLVGDLVQSAQLRDVGQRRIPSWRPARLVVTVLLCHFHQLLCKSNCCLRDSDPTTEESLPDHLNRTDPLFLGHVLPINDVAVLSK
mmetsp:Transcript_11638/g.25073  ORF Transcript_11638/g.25073 Transcript_11638/m.25073 type:complete len:244 (-) Transcript_11638:299-1030(-)